MSRNTIWRTITDTLTDELARGHYLPGDKLPTEAELAARFGVNRHTVRQALSVLTQAGLTHARRGAGVFVAAKPTDYPLGRRVRFHQALATAGRTPVRTITRLETRACDMIEAEHLGLTPGDRVHVMEGISSADGAPLASFRSVFPAARFPGLRDRLADIPSVTQALKAEGLADYTRASTRITAKTASATLALALHLPDKAPILRTQSINIDSAGQPIEYGTTWFAGDRVTLTVSPE